MSKADVLLKKAILFEKLAFEKLGQDVVPLTDLPDGQRLQETPDGRAYYAQTSPQQTPTGSVPPASFSGSSTVSRAPAAPPAPAQVAQAPAKPKPKAPPPNVPPAWLQKYMEQERLAEWAQGEIARLKAENEALKARQTPQPPKA